MVLTARSSRVWRRVRGGGRISGRGSWQQSSGGRGVDTASAASPLSEEALVTAITASANYSLVTDNKR
ncbi:hypothetical protein C4D60_Mb09t12970 [Musa balbisiana]|uniref:Uncharacterized protein n=1 Tax=Musa balbisiana TaxID=52838 RepID=A0A4V6T413_MUSBA|nr:hypothetical protein C4D60_Mb09t12970 [Musa balbisiana]